MANGTLPGYGVWNPDVLFGMQQAQPQGGSLADLLASAQDFQQQRMDLARDLIRREQLGQSLGMMDVGLQRAATAFDTPKEIQWAPRRGWGGQVNVQNPGLSMLLALLGGGGY